MSLNRSREYTFPASPFFLLTLPDLADTAFLCLQAMPYPPIFPQRRSITRGSPMASPAASNRPRNGPWNAGSARSAADQYPGASVSGRTVAAIHLMRPAQPQAIDRCDPNDVSCHPLVPFSNRIAGSHFVFHGRTVDLPPNAPFVQDVIHGHGWKTAWTWSNRHGHPLLSFPQGRLLALSLSGAQRFELKRTA